MPKYIFAKLGAAFLKEFIKCEKSNLPLAKQETIIYNIKADLICFFWLVLLQNI